MDAGRWANGAVDERPVSWRRGVYLDDNPRTMSKEDENGKDRHLYERHARWRGSGPRRPGRLPIRRLVHEVRGRNLQEWDKLKTEEALGAEALLLGGRSYDWFAKRAPSLPGEWPDGVEHLPKYIVSTTVKDPEWNNSTLIAGDVVKQLSELKQKVDGEIIVYGSYQLVRTLIEQDLADELRLFVFPVVLGTGTRLFDGISNTKPTRLIDTRVVGEGLVFYAYEFV